MEKFKTPVKFNTQVHEDIAPYECRRALDDRALSCVLGQIEAASQVFEVVTTKVHSFPDKEGYLKTEFIIDLKG